MRSIAGNNSPDLEFIAGTTGEIKKRATRLQYTLQLPRPETSTVLPETKDIQAVLTKDDLILLCKEIERFIKNPIIETPGTVDAVQLEKARRDLEIVVQLSGSIKKRAERSKH